MIGLLQMLKKRGFGVKYDFAVDYTSTNIGAIYITFIDI